MALLSSEPKPRTKGHHFRGEGAGEGDSQCGGADLPGNPKPQQPPVQTSRWRCFPFAQFGAQQARLGVLINPRQLYTPRKVKT